MTILLGLLSWTAKADVTKTVGASGADFATLKLAFDAINTNASNAYAGAVTLQIIDNTTETATATLNGGNKGVRSITSIVAGSGFQAPKVTLSGGTVNTPGTLVTTVTNGMVTGIAMTGGSYTGTFTVTIDAPSAGGVTATATVPASQTNANLTFTMTNGGSGYGPIATFSGGSPGSGAGLSVKIVSPATAPGNTPVGAALTIATARPGSGYTSTPTISIPNGWGGSGASAVVSALYNVTGYGNYTSVTIYPTVTGKTIGGDLNSALVALNGANNVTIDGRLHNTDGSLNGSTCDLTISNTGLTMGSASTINFLGGASNNTVEYCTLKGSSNVDYQATILFGSNGNSNNTIDHNLFTNAADAKRPQISLYSGGATLDNANNTVSNNEFANCMSTTLYSRAIRLVAFNSNWTISGNSFYETSTFTVPSGVTGSNLNKTMIEVGASTGHTISGNYIGGNSAQCGGTALTKTGGYDDGFNGLSISNSTNPGQANASTLYVQNNVIKNINWTNGTATSNAFNCIAIVGIGISATGNTIGDTSTGSITLTPTAGGNFFGFNISNTGGGTIDCSSNTIGSITTNTNKANIYGIYSNVLINGVTTGTNTVTNNTIGNLSQASSINAGANVVDNIVYGIRVANQGVNTVTGNTIANIVSNSASNTSSATGVFGIKIENGTSTVNGNFISKLTLPNSVGSGVVKGISIENTGIGVVATSTYSNNIISLGDALQTIYYGISEINSQGASTTNIYFNTIYIGGSQASASTSNSFCIKSSNSTTYNKNIKNNILVCTRTQPSGSNLFYGLYATTPASGGVFDCNYNDYYVSGTGSTLGNYAGSNKTVIPIVTLQTGNDGQSYVGDPVFTGAAAITAGTAVATDYKGTSSSLLGVTGSGIPTTDYASTNRTTTPSMGAWEVAYFQSKASGNWADVSSWQSSKDNSTFADVTYVPTSSAASVSILNSHTITVNTNSNTPTLTVNAGAKLTLSNGAALTVGALNLLSDPTLGNGTFVDQNTNGGLTVSATSTVNQSLQAASALRTWYITPPVASATPANMSIIKSFDEPTNTWSSSLTTINAKVGYQVVPVSGNDISFSGTLNNGNQNITLTSRTGTDNYAGFNLIGNPYPSYLDWNLVTANTSNAALMRSTTMWYRTKKMNLSSQLVYQFWTVNGDGVSSPNGAGSKIPPMQAFWVRANAGGGTLALTNAMRSHAPASDLLLKAPVAKNNTTKALVRLQVSNGTNTDETVLYASGNASNGMDTYDAPKMSNDNVAIPEIYTTVGTEQLVINAMNTLPMDTPIGLGFVAGNSSSFSLTANEISNFPAGVKVILKDNVTLAETDLTDGISTYQFSPLQTSSDRFSVIFRSAGAVTNVETPQDNSLIVYSNVPQQLTVICNDKILVGSILSVYNAIGQKLLSQALTSTSTQIAGKFSPGVYMVKVNNSTKKVIIN